MTPNAYRDLADEVQGSAANGTAWAGAVVQALHEAANQVEELNEIDRLRGIIDAAPHAVSCESYVPIWMDARPCTCWKAVVR